MSRSNTHEEASVVGRRVSYPQGLTILDLIERQVRESPDKVAVRYAEEALTYRMLDGKAAGLAATLRRGGVRKGDVVPVSIGNSLELPIGWLALMKLGAILVPFDPAWPAGRTKAALDQIRPPAILVSDERTLPADIAIRSVNVAAGDLGSGDGSPPREDLAPDDLIYGFFTSGSTGRPKCALNYHRGLFNRFSYMDMHFKDCIPKVVLLNTRHVFDSSVWQVLWTLAAAGEVVIPETVGHLDLIRTIDLIHRRSVTMTDFVPSIFNALTELIEVDGALVRQLDSLRWLLIGGEEINLQAVHKFRRLMPDVRLTNTYGPTEASIGMVFHDIGDEDRDAIPLGTPIDNTFVAILDEGLCPVPAGQVGEIFIGGDCLGGGYLGDPERTRAVFIANPIPTIPSEKLYRTGDLGRLDARGRVCFCGRLDSQVKVNGVRIELAEIEHALLNHKDVREAVVLAVEQAAADRKRLCAFIVPRADIPLASLRDHLASLLPQYMLPSEFVFRPTLPLTPNGKADRQALRQSLGSELPGPSLAPGPISEWEKEVLAQFRRTLGHDRIGIDDDFFELGGDSLSALQVVAALKAASSLDLRISDIYDSPTARTLAGRCDRARPVLSDTSELDWASESGLIDALTIPIRSSPTRPERILLTGGTGFVGAHLLAVLLKRDGLRIRALVRGDDERSARGRIHSALERYGLQDVACADRWSVVVGDLSKPRFGLDSRDWEVLERDTDCIVHCGAMVDFLHGYRHHRPHNVTGTIEVLRLATSHSAKPVHYLSTLSIFDSPADGARDEPLVQESDFPGPGDCARHGYGRSKAIAEQFVRTLRSKGLAATIYRMGEVGPSTATGVPNEKSLLTLLLKGCIRLGLYPRGSFDFDCTPVDRVAGVVAHGVGTGVGLGETLHVLQRRPLSFPRVIEGLLAAGIRVRAVPYAEFWRHLDRGPVSGDRPADLRLLQALLPHPSRVESLATSLTDATRRYRRVRFAGWFEGGAVDFPELDERRLSAMAADPRFVGGDPVSSEVAAAPAARVGSHSGQRGNP